jgi:histone H3/H4
MKISKYSYGKIKAAVRRLMLIAGAERIGSKADNILTDAILEVADEVAKEAVFLANKAKRKTVLREDIELAAQLLKLR